MLQTSECVRCVKLFKVKFKVLTAASVKMAVFWDVPPCRLVEIDGRFRGACCHEWPDDGGSKDLCNGIFLPDDTVQHPRRQSCINDMQVSYFPV
jgi:hypothetical protein